MCEAVNKCLKLSKAIHEDNKPNKDIILYEKLAYFCKYIMYMLDGNNKITIEYDDTSSLLITKEYYDKHKIFYNVIINTDQNSNPNYNLLYKPLTLSKDYCEDTVKNCFYSS